MKLQEQMDSLKRSFSEQAPDEALEIMNRAGEQLRDSGLASKAVGVGDKAPDFSLNNTSETKISLSELLTKGPVVLSFFRGRW